MQMRRWLAGVLAGTLVGCYVGPYPEDPDVDPDYPEDPSWPHEPVPGTGKPDFQIESLTGPSALSLASQELLRARLCNRGDAAGSTAVSFYLSKDNLLDPADVWVSTSATTSLPAGSCREVTARPETPNLQEGNYVLMAFADADELISEARENNNHRVGSSARVDFTPPPNPALSWKPGTSSSRPQLVVRSEANTLVRVYSGGNCSGTPVGESNSGPGAYCELPIDLPSYSSSSYSARAYDAAGNASGCSHIPAPSGNGGGYGDTTPPPPPTIIEAKWEYGMVDQDLTVKGTTEPRAEVGVFIDVQCTGFPAVTVFADANGNFIAELTVEVATPGTVRRVFVAARDAAFNESSCVEGPTYETPCPQGYANCDGDPSNGCEVDLTSDKNHCGTCGNSCQGQGNTTGVCVAGTCGPACPVGTYDCDGNPANGCESTYACGPSTCTIDRAAELAITSLSVVEDPVRTAPGGAWHIGTLMKAMAGGQDPSALVRQWLKTWNTAQTVNGLTIPARPQMMSRVLGIWEERSGGPNKPLDFSKAPFRLLAIVNRMDLRDPGVQAGEGRFVFGVLDGAGNPLEFTIIFEYALPGGTPEAIQRWARDWHELGQLGLSHPDYKTKLQALTDRFTKAGVMTGRPHGSALNQIRTNEVTLAEPWEMREFILTNTGLQPATVKLTPDLGFQNTNALRDFILANQADVLAERHTVPETLGASKFLAASAAVPEFFFWRVPGVQNEARHKFSLNTCSGCHSRETGTDFTHISPRLAGRAAVLSPYLRGMSLQDPVTGVARTFDDLGRRAEDMKALVCGTTGSNVSGESFGGFPAASNLPRARVH